MTDKSLTDMIRRHAMEPDTKDGKIGFEGVMNYLEKELNGHRPEKSRVSSVLNYLIDGGELAKVGVDRQLKYRWIGT